MNKKSKMVNSIFSLKTIELKILNYLNLWKR